MTHHVRLRERTDTLRCPLSLLLLLLLCAAAVVAAAPSVHHTPPLVDSSASDLPPPPHPSSLGSLVHVQVLHRHGDRAPVHVAPALAPLWQQLALRGGQLTPMGAAQLASLGSFMRRTYVEDSSFLPAVAGSAVSVRSTDVDRCLQSVHSLLDELYPDTMLPVHTMPEEQEKLLQATDKCPSYLVGYRGILGELDEVLLHELTTLPPQFADDGRAPPHSFNLLEVLASESGYGSQLLPANLVTVMNDNIVCLRAHGLPVPPSLLRALPLLRNKTSAVYFHKFSPLHVRRAWARTQGRTTTLHDEEAGLLPNGGNSLDPRGTVGGVLARHIVHHWEKLLVAQQAYGEGIADSRTSELSSGTQKRPLGDGSRYPLSVEQDDAAQADEAAVAAAWEQQVEQWEVATKRHLLQVKRPRLRMTHNTPSLSEPLRADSPSPLPPHSPVSRAKAMLAHSRPRRRSKYSSGATVAKLAAEKLQIYSAHDTTIISLMQSLGLITAPDSEYLLPPYGASVTFELRRRDVQSSRSSGGEQEDSDGLFVNAFYGFPVPLSDSSSDDVRWEYHRHPLALRCPGEDSREDWEAPKQWQCSLDTFRRYIQLTTRSSATAAVAADEGAAALAQNAALVTSQAYAADDGCCVRTPAFYALGCGVTAAATPSLSGGAAVPTELERECVAFRQRCPATACPTGHVLDPTSLACVAVSQAATPGKQTHDASHLSAAAGSELPLLVPVNGGGEAAALPPPAHPLASLSPSPSYLPFMLFGACCVLVGFGLGVVYTRRRSSRFRSRGKDAYEYELGGGSGDEGARRQFDGQLEKDSLLTRNAGKRKTAPNTNIASDLP